MPDTGSTLVLERRDTGAGSQPALVGSTGAELYVRKPPALFTVKDEFRMAGYSWRDLQFAEFYDCYTILLAASLTRTANEVWGATPPTRDMTRLEKALAYLRTTPHRRANRGAKTKQLMKSAVRLLEELEAVSPTSAPTDLSTNLDKYLYDAG